MALLRRRAATGLAAAALVAAVVVVVVVGGPALAQAQSQPAIPDEHWMYSQVRRGVNIFWWLYGASDRASRDSKPLIVWLQGPHAAASSGEKVEGGGETGQGPCPAPEEAAASSATVAGRRGAG